MPHDLAWEDDDFKADLRSQMAEECVYHRMAVQKQLDDMRRTFKDMFDDHCNVTDRLMEEQRRNGPQQPMEGQREASEQHIQTLIDRCHNLEMEAEKTTSVLQGVCEVLCRLKHIADASQGLRNKPPFNEGCEGNDTSIQRRETAELETLQREQTGRQYRADKKVSLVGESEDLESAEHSSEPPDRPRHRPTTTAMVAEAAGLEVVAFNKTVFDAAVFIGCPEVGSCGSLFTALALLICIAIQLVFIVIVNDSLTPPHITQDVVDGYVEWRTTIAHNIRFLDDMEYKSLTKKVCEFRDAPMSSGSIDGINKISEYLGLSEQDRSFRDPPPLGYVMPAGAAPVGLMMCCMALTFWFLDVWKEIWSIGVLFQGFTLLPHGETTISENPDGGLSMTQVSKVRRGMFYGIMAVRLAVCLAMGLFGALYLAATISLGDLLLNALALEIVLSLDTLAFEAFAPSSVRALTSLIAPLPRPRSRSWRGLDLRPIAALLAITGGVFGVWRSVLLGQRTLLEEAKAAICDGNQDFVWTRDAAGVVVVYNPMDPMMGGAAEFDVTSQYVYRAVRETIEHGPPQNLASIHTGGAIVDIGYGYPGSRFTLEGRTELDVITATHLFNKFCEDLDTNSSESGELLWPVLSDILMSETARSGLDYGPFTSCSDVAPLCDGEDVLGTRARQYCPITCGCDDPGAHLALFDPEMGCPVSCVGTPAYAQALGDMNCTDWAPDYPRVLSGVDLKDAYLEGVWRTGWPQAYIEVLTQTMNATLYESGCPGLVAFMEATTASSHWLFGNLCFSSNPIGFRPITSICPVSCGCRQSNEWLCPTTC